MRPAESFIQQPVRSLQTMLQVLAEEDPSLPALIPDGIYGPSTMVAVTAFQRREGLPVTGITDGLTWERIVDTYEPALIRIGKAEPIEILLRPGQVIEQGQKSPYMYLLQAMLAQLSEGHEAIGLPAHTGRLDPITADSLRGFQSLAGLPVTGTLDRITWHHLVRQFTLNAALKQGASQRENN